MPDDLRTKPYSVRMTEAEYAKFIALGGAVWVREKIKRAPLPAPEELK